MLLHGYTSIFSGDNDHPLWVLGFLIVFLGLLETHPPAAPQLKFRRAPVGAMAQSPTALSPTALITDKTIKPIETGIKPT
jgi:hypothetical protein